MHSVLVCWHLKARELFNLAQKYGRLHSEGTANVEDAPERRVGLSQFDEADKCAFIAGLGGKGLLAHLQP